MTTIPPAPPPNSPSATAPAAHPRDRRTTVIVAWIAIIGVFLGAVVAAGSSFWTANITANEASDQSKDEFRRGQQRDAYAAYLEAINEYTSASSAISVAFLFIDAPDYPFEYNKQVNAVLDAQTKLGKAEATVSLIGSKHVVAAVNKLEKPTSEVARIAAESLKFWYANPRNVDKIKDIEKEYNGNYSDLAPLVLAYVKEAREDLGVG